MPLIMPNGDTWDRTLLTRVEQAPVYSDGDRTASAIGISLVRTLTAQTAGRWYGELTIVYPGAASDAYRVGVLASTSAVNTQFASIRLGEDLRSVGWTAKGHVMFNDFVSEATPYGSGDIVSIALDRDRARIWFRVNGGVWGDERNTINSMADPALGSGGEDIGDFGVAAVFIAVMLSPGSAVSIGARRYALPSGFLSWLNPPGADIAQGQINLARPVASAVMFTGQSVARSGMAVLPLPDAQGAVASFNPDAMSWPIDRTGAQARVNLFDIPIIVPLVLTLSRKGNPVLMNYPINRSDFHLVRGVPNMIQFFVRDVDRHIAAGPLANAVLSVNIVDPEAQAVLMQRDLLTINAANGLYALATQAVDMLDWPAGALRYSVLVSRADGTQSLLWTDRNYTPYGVCMLLDGPLPNPLASIRLDPTEFIAQDGYSYSTAVAGAAAKGYPNGLQTFAFYTTDFTANVVIQASLVEQPSSEAQNWFTVSYHDFAQANGVTAVNVAGNFLWLRVAVPNTNPLPYPGYPVLPPPNGQIEQILYRN